MVKYFFLNFFYFCSKKLYVTYCTHDNSSKKGWEHHRNIINCPSYVSTDFWIHMVLQVNEFTVTYHVLCKQQSSVSIIYKHFYFLEKAIVSQWTMHTKMYPNFAFELCHIKLDQNIKFLWKVKFPWLPQYNILLNYKCNRFLP